MRPLKKGLDYFPHDTDATGDEKIQSLMALHGPAGYAFYFILLERVFRSENGRITCGKPLEKAGLARLICISSKQFEAILETALEIGCFDREAYDKDKALTSSGVQKRIERVTKIRQQEKERKERIKENKDLKDKREIEIENQRGKTPGKPPENPQGIIKGRKAKESPATTIPENFGISEAVREWARKNGLDHLDERLEHFKDWAKGGKDGPKKYCDWDATFRNAIRGDYAQLNNKKRNDYI